MEIKEFMHDDTPFKTTVFQSETRKGSILIAPAMGITAKYYIAFASWLCEQGYIVMILDYEGTGLSGAENIKNCKATFNDWVKNIEIVGQDLKKNNPSFPLIFLGHSIGSQLFGFVEDINLFDKAFFIASSTGY